MSAYWHEFRHQLLTATVVGTLVVLGVLGALGGDSSVPQAVGAYQLVYYYSSGYHFVFFVSDTDGLPLKGAHVMLNLSNASTGATVALLNGVTAANGLLLWSADIPELNYSYTFFVSGAGSSGNLEGQSGFPLTAPGPGAVVSGFQPAHGGPGAAYSLAVGFWSTSTFISVLAADPGHGVPTGYEARYVLANQSVPPINQLTEGNTTYLGTLDSYQTSFSWRVTVPNPEGEFVDVCIFAPNGTLMEFANLPAPSSSPGIGSGENSVQGFLGGIQLLVALLGLVLGYARYGKDRALRTLESVLWRPVTRSGLFLVRTGTMLIPLAAGAGLLLGVLDAWILFALHSGIPLPVLLTLFGILLAEGSAFAGIVVLSSHLLRSRGGVIGALVGAFLFFGILYTIVVAVVSSMLPLRASIDFTFNASFWDPAQLQTPTFLLLIPQEVDPYFMIAPGSPAHPTWTLSVPLLAGVAAAWAVVPFVVAFVLALKRD